MTSLDTFREVDATTDAECSDCGATTGCLTFWTTYEADHEPDAAFCLHCLFDVDGRYKHQPPAHVLRDHESIQSVDERDDVVVVTTTSSLGTVRYVHHMEPTVERVGSSTEQQRQKVRIVRSGDLTGTYEAFTAEGEFLAATSPYHDVAADYLRPDAE